MKFINKTLNQVQGRGLVDTFLNSRWDNVARRYSNIDYSTEPNHPFKLSLRNPLRQLLLREQNSYCCYCMRLINANSTTFEHVVAKSRSTITQTTLDQYSNYPIIRNSVCLQSIFDNARVKLNTPPYPLEIAYENLTASCNGKFLPDGVSVQTCNCKRQDNFILPLFYISTIQSEIVYRNGGLIESLNNSYDASINTLRLNHNTLQKVRQVWYHISVENIGNIENADTELKRNVILTTNLISLPSTRRNQLIGDFKTETFWNVLLQYKWFYDYYKRTYPIVNR